MPGPAAELSAHLTTERDLALVLSKHIPVFMRKKTFAKMETQDDKRRIRGEDPSTRQEMIAIAREVEMNIIAHEAEMRKCGEIPPPRSTDPCTNEAPPPDHVATEVGGDNRTKRLMADRLGERVLLKDRLGSRVGEPSAPDNRRCHFYAHRQPGRHVGAQAGQPARGGPDAQCTASL